jgi:LysR family transcriptional regulator, transcriptional activator for bauABCD operon
MRLHPRGFAVKIGDIDIRLLRVFCTIARCGGFAAAESELQLGLPSISRYIKDLEIRLGVRLCQRGRVGFALTDQGRQVYAASLRLIADLKRFETEVRSIHSALAGTLSIGVMDAMISDRNLPLPQILKEYKLKHPRVEFHVQTRTANAIEQSVIEGTLDAGLIFGRRHMSQLDYKHLYQERQSLYCSEGHPLFDRDAASLSVDEVANYDYAGFSFLDDGDRAPVDGLLVKTATVDSMEAMATLVASGCFLAILPDHYVQSLWRLKSFRSVLPEVFSYSTDIELVTRHGGAAPMVLALLDLFDAPAASARPIKRAAIAALLDRIEGAPHGASGDTFAAA